MPQWNTLPVPAPYIAVATNAYAASELSLKLHDLVKTLYQS